MPNKPNPFYTKTPVDRSMPPGDFKMPFGKHRGETLNEIASTNEGLLYLDWLRGEREDNPKNDTVEFFLSKFLDQPDVQADLDLAMDDYPRDDRY